MSRPAVLLPLLALLAGACGGGGDGGDDGPRTVSDSGTRDDASSACPDLMPEVCNGLDDDCDGAIDEEATDALAFYRDADGDGFGAGAELLRACSAAEGLSPTDDDCDDRNPFVHPGALEVCNERDDDCSGFADDGSLNLIYQDLDGDGLGDESCFLDACVDVEGFVPRAGDCDDRDSSIGALDDCELREPRRAEVLFEDADGDGYGTGLTPAYGCDARSGVAPNARDCDDTDPTINPAARDLCDGIDQNCDGEDGCGSTDGVTPITDEALIVVRGTARQRVGQRLHPLGLSVSIALAPAWAADACEAYLVERFETGLTAAFDTTCAETAAPAGSASVLRTRDGTLTLRGELSGVVVIPRDFDNNGAATGEVVLGRAMVDGVDAVLVLLTSEPHSEGELARLHAIDLEELQQGRYTVVAEQALDTLSPNAWLLDVDADGAQDVVIGDPDSGTLQVWSAPLVAAEFEGTPTRTFVGPGDANGRFGHAVAAAELGGTAVLAVGAPDDRNGLGAVYLYDLRTGALTDTFVGDEVGSRFGASLAIDEASGTLYIGAPQRRAGELGNGLVFAFVLDNAAGEPAARLAGADHQAALGESLAVVESEGDAWLLLGAPGTNGGGGVLYAISLPAR